MFKSFCLDMKKYTKIQFSFVFLTAVISLASAALLVVPNASAQTKSTLACGRVPGMGAVAYGFEFIDGGNGSAANPGQRSLCCCSYYPGKPLFGGNDSTAGNTICPTQIASLGCTKYVIVPSSTTGDLSTGKIPQIDPASGAFVEINQNPFAKLGDFIAQWFTVAFYLAVVLATLMVFYGGFSYAIAAGDSGKTGEAKEIILDAIIGLGVALLAGAILTLLRGPGVFTFS